MQTGVDEPVKTIFITGATGFIGCRLAEIACAHQISVVGLVRMWPHAVRLARLPVRMVYGDVLDIDVLRRAMKGCDVVFHCAVDNSVGGQKHRAITVNGTANVMQAALDTGVRCVVHVSSVGVYSYSPGADAAIEEGAYRYSGDIYCDSKIDAEKIVLAAYRDHGLPVVIVRPTNVYGPFGYYTADTVARIRQKRMVLVNGGTGICNTLYVDNLVEAMLLAARHPEAPGQIFHVSDEKPVTWKTFVEVHARAIGENFLPLPEMTVAEIATARRRLQRRASSLYKTLALLRDPRTRAALSAVPIVRRCMDATKYVARAALSSASHQWLQKQLQNPIANSNSDAADQFDYLPSPGEVDLYSSNVVFRIDKARRILGYAPGVDFVSGMERTKAWLRWAQL
jgi:nucleoside-diphosphate-sugar epimerase